MGGGLMALGTRLMGLGLGMGEIQSVARELCGRPCDACDPRLLDGDVEGRQLRLRPVRHRGACERQWLQRLGIGGLGRKLRRCCCLGGYGLGVGKAETEAKAERSGEQNRDRHAADRT